MDICMQARGRALRVRMTRDKSARLKGLSNFLLRFRRPLELWADGVCGRLLAGARVNSFNT